MTRLTVPLVYGKVIIKKVIKVKHYYLETTTNELI